MVGAGAALAEVCSVLPRLTFLVSARQAVESRSNCEVKGLPSTRAHSTCCGGPSSAQLDKSRATSSARASVRPLSLVIHAPARLGSIRLRPARLVVPDPPVV